MKKENLNNAEMEEVYEMYKDIVVQTAGIYLDRHAAEDIAQEVFIKYFRLVKEKHIKSPRAWLMTVARNLSYNYIRDNKKVVPIDMDVVGEDFFGLEDSTENLYIESLPIEMKAETKNFKKPLLEALYQKNKVWYEGVILTYLMKRPQIEVAEQMGMKVDALQSMLYRAKRWIWHNYGTSRRQKVEKKDA